MIWSRYHKFLTFLAALAAAASLAALVLPAWGRRDYLAHLISLWPGRRTPATPPKLWKATPVRAV